MRYLTFFVVGESSLFSKVVEELVQRKHVIAGAASPDKACEEHVRQLEVPFFSSPHDPAILDLCIDYVLCVVNYIDLPPTVRALPTRYCINYHDSPLPRYAGFYATSWALYNGETTYGCNWHVLEPLIDSGDIVARADFDVRSSDTALTLNLRCHEHAFTTFRVLLKSLESDTVIRQAQVLSDRTYTRFYERPGLLMIDWNAPSARIMRDYRASALGEMNYNPWGVTKFAAGCSAYAVHRMRTENESSDARPGFVLSADEKSGLRIKCRDSVCVISEMSCNGVVVRPGEFASMVGQCLTFLPRGCTLPEGVEWHEKLVRREKYWLGKLQRMVPFKQPTETNANAAERTHFKHKFPHVYTIETCLAALAFQFSRSSDDMRSDGSCRLCFGLSETTSVHVPPFTAAVLPGELNVTKTMSVADLLQAASKQIAEMRENTTYLTDLHDRFRSLPPIFKVDCLLCVDKDENSMHEQISKFNASACLHLSTKCGTCHLFVNGKVGSSFVSSVRNILQYFGSPGTEQAALSDFQAQRPCILKGNDSNANDVMDQFNRACEVSRSRTALVCKDSKIDYCNAKEFVALLAQNVESMTASQSSIGILLVPSSKLVLTTFACLSAGRHFVMLSQSLPSLRLKYMIETSTVSLCISTRDLERVWNSFPTQMAMLGEHGTLDLDASSTSNTSSIVNPSTDTAKPLAYILFTSGSTGRPKGAMVYRHSLSCLVDWMVDVFSFTEQDTLLFKTPCIFDACIWEIFVPLCHGGCTVVAPDGAHAQPQLLAELIQDRAVTLLQLVPSLAPVLFGALEGSCHSLRMLFLGGEALTWQAIHSYIACGVPCINLYGPTECCVQSLIHCIKPVSSSKTPPSVIPIGRPARGNGAVLRDAMGGAADRGCAGELCIFGQQVGAGYVNNKEQTSANFFPANIVLKSLSNTPLYRTGDCVQSCDDGYVYIGRLDSQIKLRGQRLEISEIEQVLLSCDGVSDGVVVVCGESGEQKLFAVLAPITAPIEQAQQACSKSLPSYMVPEHWKTASPETWPRLPSGKLDRRRIRADLEANELENVVADKSDCVPSAILSFINMIRADLDLSRGNYQLLLQNYDKPLLSCGLSSLFLMRMQQFIKRKKGIELDLNGLGSASIVSLVDAKGEVDASNSDAKGHSEKYESIRDLISLQPLLIFGGFGFPFVEDLQTLLQNDSIKPFAEMLVEGLDKKGHIAIAVSALASRGTVESISKCDSDSGNNIGLALPLLYLYHVCVFYFHFLSFTATEYAQLFGDTAGVIGHSFGLFAALTVAASDTLKHFEGNACSMFPVVIQLANHLSSCFTSACEEDMSAGQNRFAMQAINDASPHSIYAALKQYEISSRAVSIGVINSPTSCVVSGRESSVSEFIGRLQTDGHIFTTKALGVPWAGHTSLMEPATNSFLELSNALPTFEPIWNLVSPEDGARIRGELSLRRCIELALHRPMNFWQATHSCLYAVDRACVIDIGPSISVDDKRFGAGIFVSQQRRLCGQILTCIPTSNRLVSSSFGVKSLQGQPAAPHASVALVQIRDIIQQHLGEIDLSLRPSEVLTDSIKVLRLTHDLQEALGFGVDSSKLWSHATLTSFAQSLAAGKTPTSHIAPKGDEENIPCRQTVIGAMSDLRHVVCTSVLECIVQVRLLWILRLTRAATHSLGLAAVLTSWLPGIAVNLFPGFGSALVALPILANYMGNYVHFFSWVRSASPVTATAYKRARRAKRGISSILKQAAQRGEEAWAYSFPHRISLRDPSSALQIRGIPRIVICNHGCYDTRERIVVKKLFKCKTILAMVTIWLFRWYSDDSKSIRDGLFKTLNFYSPENIQLIVERLVKDDDALAFLQPEGLVTRYPRLGQLRSGYAYISDMVAKERPCVIIPMNIIFEDAWTYRSTCFVEICEPIHIDRGHMVDTPRVELALRRMCDYTRCDFPVPECEILPPERVDKKLFMRQNDEILFFHALRAAMLLSLDGTPRLTFDALDMIRSVGKELSCEKTKSDLSAAYVDILRIARPFSSALMKRNHALGAHAGVGVLEPFQRTLVEYRATVSFMSLLCPELKLIMQKMQVLGKSLQR